MVLIAGASSAVALDAVREPEVRAANFAGSTDDSKTKEAVDVKGRMEIVTELTGSEATGWDMKLVAVAEATGKGKTSAKCYVATGIDTGDVKVSKGQPDEASFLVGFPLVELEPIVKTLPPASTPLCGKTEVLVEPRSVTDLPLLVKVAFKSTGKVTGVEVKVPIT